MGSAYFDPDPDPVPGSSALIAVQIAKVFGADFREEEIKNEAVVLPPTGWVKSVAGMPGEGIPRA
jgi:hypothetical protein